MRVHTHTVAAIGLAALALTVPALAAPGHGPGGPGPGRPGGGGPARLAQVSGTITAIGASTITVTSANGTATVLTIASGTDIIGTQTTAASAIALGDTLLVTGIPVTLQAASIVDDKRATTKSTTTSTGTTSTGTTSAAPVPATLRVMGIVTALSPPTITVDDSFSLALTTTSTTTFQEVSDLTLSQLATGETVSAHVMTNGTTTTALEVDVTP